MRRYLIILFGLLMLVVTPHLEALFRDSLSCSDDVPELTANYPCCYKHSHMIYYEDEEGNSDDDEYEDDKELHWDIIPSTGSKCNNLFFRCANKSIYWGYFRLPIDSVNYVRNFNCYLRYCHRNKNCLCYWPECSQQAAEISDLAYTLFDDLFSTTALSPLLKDPEEQCHCLDLYHQLNKHGLILSCIVRQFFFSEYHSICGQIEAYSKYRCGEREFAQIKDKLDTILEELYPKFYSLYTSCYTKHPNSVIARQIFYMNSIANDLVNVNSTDIPALPLFNDCNSFEIQNGSNDELSKNKTCECFDIFDQLECRNFRNRNVADTSGDIMWNEDELLSRGTMFNDLMLNKDSIALLSQLLQGYRSYYTPSFDSWLYGHSLSWSEKWRNAFTERALAYFETNQFSLAMQDYITAKKLTVIPPFKPSCFSKNIKEVLYIPDNKIEFSKGLILGIKEGSKTSAVEFLPSLYGSCRGIATGLWAFACSPQEVTSEFLDAIYAIGQFVYVHRMEETFQCVVPELKELSLSWDTINDYSRGQKIGYIISKYGVDILIPIGAIKGVNKLRSLKRANVMLTLERCAASEESQVAILKESVRRANFREKAIALASKKGKILIKNQNVKYHIMQEKHTWEKVVELTGSVEEDFEKVLTLLEENNVISDANLKNITKFGDSSIKITIHEYRKTINGHELQVFCENYSETGESFLKNAWVNTRN